mgnify:CR=1 FL=1
MEKSSGAIIREARLRAGLSQTDLARRCGVAQSVISAYEADRREPGLRTLTKLVEATGHALSLELTTTGPRERLGLPDTPLGKRLRHRRRALLDTAARYGVHDVRVFGSVARGEDTESSDVDLLVELDANIGLLSLAKLTRELSEVVGVEVDVVPAGSLKATIRDDVLNEAIAL